ncbi:unnamed protein product [Dicrocoelium dendriticum]|nr:unnamed protein product [Dicrocoelium dendriticum]
MDFCTPNPCLNGGICLNREGDFICFCSQGFEGELCSNKISRASSSPPSVMKDQVAPSIDRCDLIGCPKELSSDGQCDPVCLANECGGSGESVDCMAWIPCWENTGIDEQRMKQLCVTKFHDGRCDNECNMEECHFDGFDCASGKHTTCQNMSFCKEHYGDGICDTMCSGPDCGFDGGDCNVQAKSTLPPTIAHYSKPSGYSSNLYVILLNSTPKEFSSHRREFLAIIGTALQAEVKIWYDRLTGSEMLMELPRNDGMKVRKYGSSVHLSLREKWPTTDSPTGYCFLIANLECQL